jgi:hypothetical protein
MGEPLDPSNALGARGSIDGHDFVALVDWRWEFSMCGRPAERALLTVTRVAAVRGRAGAGEGKKAPGCPRRRQ